MNRRRLLMLAGAFALAETEQGGRSWRHRYGVDPTRQ